jgi:hypothetical protein
MEKWGWWSNFGLICAWISFKAFFLAQTWFKRVSEVIKVRGGWPYQVQEILGSSQDSFHAWQVQTIWISICLHKKWE